MKKVARLLAVVAIVLGLAAAGGPAQAAQPGTTTISIRCHAGYTCPR